jgi:hypothetical protein
MYCRFGLFWLFSADTDGFGRHHRSNVGSSKFSSGHCCFRAIMLFSDDSAVFGRHVCFWLTRLIFAVTAYWSIWLILAVTDTIDPTLSPHDSQEMRKSFKKSMEHNISFLWVMLVWGIIEKLPTYL